MLFRHAEGDVRGLEGIDDHKKRLRRDDVSSVHADVSGTSVHGGAYFAVGKIELGLFQRGRVLAHVCLCADHGDSGGIGFRGAGEAAFLHFECAGVIILRLGELGLVAFQPCLRLMQGDLIGFLFNDEKKLSLLHHFAVAYEHLLKFPARARNNVYRSGRFHGAHGVQHVGHILRPGSDERHQRGTDGAGLRFFGFAGTADQQRDTDKTQKNSSGHGDSRRILAGITISSIRREKFFCQEQDGKVFLSKDCRALHKKQSHFHEFMKMARMGKARNVRIFLRFRRLPDVPSVDRCP